ncbi:hypothetical protein KC19_VG212600 [Ceratodon purpureus]|uniref:Secreted protein n=1 Tax=Ceratodon purpureus TaxID=3225 RepID=A0A8T0HSL7_CERPU|nr:hypothetical protein KC19_VG212600 [Ceratodon purpureus]
MFRARDAALHLLLLSWLMIVVQPVMTPFPRSLEHRATWPTSSSKYAKSNNRRSTGLYGEQSFYFSLSTQLLQNRTESPHKKKQKNNKKKTNKKEKEASLFHSSQENKCSETHVRHYH